jgi:hypothetical protein
VDDIIHARLGGVGILLKFPELLADEICAILTSLSAQRRHPIQSLNQASYRVAAFEPLVILVNLVIHAWRVLVRRVSVGMKSIKKRSKS